MKKILCFALLFLLSTLAFSQCVPPPIYDSLGAPTGKTANWPVNSAVGPYDAPDYFACANYASSPLPKRSCSDTAQTACYGDLDCALLPDATNPLAPAVCSGAPAPNTGIRKFVDTLPGLTPAGANNLGQYIPLGTPDITTYPGSDYYEIELVEYSEKMHSDLLATKLRGYVQRNNGTNVAACQPAGCTAADNTIVPDPNPHYLGPTILAQRDRPVRILFRNKLPAGSGGDLFLPVDTTIMGSGVGPDALGAMPTNNGLVTDAARNPECGTNPKPAICFTENRATLHLHGGLTPWVSDGTPHQWITPDGEREYPDATLPAPRTNKGVSVVNVPDMPDPGPGAQTFFYTNQQSARLMFYHDHAWGITRLNVYAGEAAGYLVTDAAEQALMGTNGALSGLKNAIPYGIPLVIQDRTFVPPADQLAKEDPTWDMIRWGGVGSLWASHVYMPAQNPGDVTGMNGFGRWMYGPYFWPPATPLYGPIANPYYTSDLTICDPDPTAQGWCQPPLIPGTPNNSVGQEAFNDTPIVNGTAYPTLTVEAGEYRFRILNAANDRFWNLQWYVADATGKEVAFKAAELAAAQLDPNIVPTPDPAISPAGPAWIQIGTEGGFLPAPAVIPNQVTTWIIDPTRFDVGNVDKHSLLIAPAERADVVVDFSQFAGKTLILYNDAPAAFPARVATYDYYTGGPDQTDAGGAPSTQPGFGPNTRTIMQVVVSGSGGAATPDYVNPARLTALQAAFAHHLDPVTNAPAGVFESSQDPIIVGQGAYNTAYGTNFRFSNPRDGFARIADFSLAFNTLLTGNSTSTLSIPFQPKGMHDEMNAVAFDDYGRMTANIGFEVPNPGPAAQNIVLYPYINPPIRATDGFIARDDLDPIALPAGTLQVDRIASAADGTQIWKITHNGVDTHPIHFHLFNVQLLNRVTWDNRILQPDPNELGWKDTVRVSPLEDTIVALRPIVPKIPFGVPDSLRPLNPAMPLGNTAGFENTDPNGNGVTAIQNAMTDFGWEYVWHCHILGHEEMDMMRPLIANVSRLLPAAPVVTNTGSDPIAIAWTDGTPVNYAAPAFWGDPTNEIGYRIKRAVVDLTTNTVGAYFVIGTALANQISFTDVAANPTLAYSYIVVAYNAAGESPSAPLPVRPATPTVMAIVAPAITFRQNGVVTVNVTSTTGVVTGNVTLTLDAGAPITLALSNGSAMFDNTNTPVLLAPAVGNHSLVANFAPQNGFGASTASGTLVVNQAALTITASSQVIPFGSAVAAITPTIVGLVAPDTIADLGALVCSTTATATSPAGTYPTSCSGAVNTNYAITYVNGTVTITNASVVITASSQVVPYGSAVAAITPTVIGLVAPDTIANLPGLACTTTATQGSPVGTYPTNCSGAVNANYTFAYVPGTVTITAVPLTITANNATRAFGAANPAFSAAYAGFVNGDTPASLSGTLACTTTANATSPAGNYPITCSGQTSANYTITYVPGVLTVTALGPILTLAPVALTFSSPINVTSVSQLVTVSNSGSAPLRISAINLGGANPGRFGLTHNCPIGGAGLAAGGNCTVNVTFTPNSNTARSALLRVLVAAPAVSGSVTLTGTAVLPVAILSTGSLAFGNVPINTISAPQTVTVTNSGTVPLVFTSIAMGGLNAARFPQTNDCPIGGAGLAPNSSCTVTITFQPNRRAARSATLTIRDNAPNSPQTVALTGTGI
jgi:FtsP/CotA-like multicopper oxidase with cupredoxin domain